MSLTIKEVEKKIYKDYPKLTTSLYFKTPLQILIATILSAQCTDARVNIVTKSLFKKYKKVEDFANVKIEELEQDIRSTGFYRNKAKNIKATAIKIINDFNSKVPKKMEGILTLPGVARKTANVVLGNAYGTNEGIPVDTHVSRLSQRMGLSKNKDPVKIEADLMKLVKKENYMYFSHGLILHGRNVCDAKKPNCKECTFKKNCPKIGVKLN